MRLSRRSLAASIIITLFAGATYLLAWSPVFEVSAITVKGAPKEISSAVIVRAS